MGTDTRFREAAQSVQFRRLRERTECRDKSFVLHFNLSTPRRRRFELAV
jgi:hypothetical protein